MTHPDRYELHPLCTLFPRLTGAEFETLREDIRVNGQREPILLHEGMILDGSNRYEACLQAGIAPAFKPFEGGDVVAYVFSANLYRRHLSPGQSAAIVASITHWAEAHKPGRPKKSGNAAAFPAGDGTLGNAGAGPEKRGNAAPFSSVAQRAAVSGASARTQRMADKVAQADPELARQVAHGQTSLAQALAIVEGKACPASQHSAAQPAEAAHDDDAFESPAELMADMARDIRDLQAQVDAMKADDQRAQTLQWRSAHQVLERRCNEHLSTIAARDREIARLSNQIKRCGKAVGQDDPDQVAAAVEAFVRRFAAASKEVA